MILDADDEDFLETLSKIDDEVIKNQIIRYIKDNYVQKERVLQVMNDICGDAMLDSYDNFADAMKKRLDL